MINKMGSIGEVRKKPHPSNWDEADWMGMAESKFPGGLKFLKPNTEINPFQVDRKTSNTEKVKLHSTEWPLKWVFLA